MKICAVSHSVNQFSHISCVVYLTVLQEYFLVNLLVIINHGIQIVCSDIPVLILVISRHISNWFHISMYRDIWYDGCESKAPVDHYLSTLCSSTTCGTCYMADWWHIVALTWNIKWNGSSTHWSPGKQNVVFSWWFSKYIWLLSRVFH